MKYQTTKSECRKQITGVCWGCGGKLEPIKTVDNAGNPTYWAGCMNCSRFCYGVDPKIWRTARNLVEKGRLHPIDDMRKCEYENSEDAKNYWLDEQTFHAVYIILDVLNEWEKVSHE